MEQNMLTMITIAALAVAAGFLLGFLVRRYAVQARVNKLQQRAEQYLEKAEKKASDTVLAARDEALRVRSEAEKELARRREGLRREEKRTPSSSVRGELHPHLRLAGNHRLSAHRRLARLATIADARKRAPVGRCRGNRRHWIERNRMVGAGRPSSSTAHRLRLCQPRSRRRQRRGSAGSDQRAQR